MSGQGATLRIGTKPRRKRNGSLGRREGRRPITLQTGENTETLARAGLSGEGPVSCSRGTAEPGRLAKTWRTASGSLCGVPSGDSAECGHGSWTLRGECKTRRRMCKKASGSHRHWLGLPLRWRNGGLSEFLFAHLYFLNGACLTLGVRTTDAGRVWSVTDMQCLGGTCGGSVGERVPGGQRLCDPPPHPGSPAGSFRPFFHKSRFGRKGAALVLCHHGQLWAGPAPVCGAAHSHVLPTSSTADGVAGGRRGACRGGAFQVLGPVCVLRRGWGRGPHRSLGRKQGPSVLLIQRVKPHGVHGGLSPGWGFCSQPTSSVHLGSRPYLLLWAFQGCPGDVYI